MSARTYVPHMPVGDQRWMERKNETRVAWQRQDWRASLDDIAWEHEWFRNDIPFSGDVRALLINTSPNPAGSRSDSTGPQP